MSIPKFLMIKLIDLGFKTLHIEIIILFWEEKTYILGVRLKITILYMIPTSM